jgi:hypothetical protein
MPKQYICDHASRCPIRGCPHKVPHRLRVWKYQDCTTKVECYRIAARLGRPVEVQCVEVQE